MQMETIYLFKAFNGKSCGKEVAVFKPLIEFAINSHRRVLIVNPLPAEMVSLKGFEVPAKQGLDLLGIFRSNLRIQVI